MKSRPRSNWGLHVAIGSALLTLLAVGAISYRATLVSGESDRWVRHSHEVLEDLETILSTMERIQSVNRAFVLTGDVAYLASVRETKAKAEWVVAKVRKLTADNPTQQGHLLVLGRLAAEQIRITDEITRLRLEKGLEAATAAMQEGSSQRVIDALRDVLDDMKREEQGLLVSRDVDARRRLDQTRVLLVTGTLLGLSIAAAAGWIAQRSASRRATTEAALHDSELQCRMLIQGIEDHAIVMLGPDGEFVSWNPGAERLMGHMAEPVVGKTFARFFPGAGVERGRPEEALELAAANGEHQEQSQRTRSDGSQFSVRTTFTALRDAKGRLRGFSMIIRDLSETKEARAKYRGLLEAAPDAMVVVNQSGEIVLLNLQAEKQFGYRRDELVGRVVTTIIPEGFAERLIADGTRDAAEALAQHMGTGIELHGQRKDGSTFPIEIMLSPLASAEGTLVTAAIRDISVRKAAERHLALMEGRYRGLLEAAPDAMVVVNQAGEIVLVNLQAERKFGYRRDELLGQQVKAIIAEGFAERLVADALRSSEDALAQQMGTGIELTGRRKDGSDFPIEIMLSPLASAEGTLVTAAIRDITTRKLADAELLDKVAELNRSNEELGQFAYVTSHDLQEPLRMVASYTQLLSRRYKGKLDKDADTFIDFAVDGANRMQRLIRDLLAYSRVGTKGIRLVETSSEDALRQTLINLRGAIEDSGALVTHDPLPQVNADETQLVQLLQNLVGNAIKYQQPGIPRVHISAARDDDQRWLFSIKDNGLGIDPQYFERIFGVFQRLHKRDEFAGTGIGLAICKKIVERHGGRISVESQPGLGSTFRFALAGSEMTA